MNKIETKIKRLTEKASIYVSLFLSFLPVLLKGVNLDYVATVKYK